MQRTLVWVPAMFLLCFSAWATERQNTAAPVASPDETQISGLRDVECKTSSEAPRDETDASGPQFRAPSDSGDAISTPDAAPSEVDLGGVLKLLAERQSALAQCILTIDVQLAAQDSPGACAGELLLNFAMRHDGEPEKDIPIGRLAGTSAFFYESGMTIDADGAPNAYHPDNTGLDDLANAGAPGRWEGLAKDPNGEPYIQGPDDPFPGYYVSATALADHSKAVSDPARYVDASRIPFIVLPGGMARQIGARPGDFAVIFNRRNGKSAYAIFGDVGPIDRLGEGSVALAENLGIRSDARNGGAHGGILYMVFPGSGNGRPRTIAEIDTEGRRLLQAWESALSRSTCAVLSPAEMRKGSPAGN